MLKLSCLEGMPARLSHAHPLCGSTLTGFTCERCHPPPLGPPHSTMTA